MLVVGDAKTGALQHLWPHLYRLLLLSLGCALVVDAGAFLLQVNTYTSCRPHVCKHDHSDSDTLYKGCIWVRELEKTSYYFNGFRGWGLEFSGCCLCPALYTTGIPTGLHDDPVCVDSRHGAASHLFRREQGLDLSGR